MLNIFDIQRSSYHDGPGIRTVVFLKGCNLRCFWCQNPESQRAEHEIMAYPALCIGCGQCIDLCPAHCHRVVQGEKVFLREHCVRCFACTDCNAEALVRSGRYLSVEDVFAIAMEDKKIYDISGGGVTLSGGEPLLQYQEAAKLLKKCKEAGVHTAIETAGCAAFETFAAMLPYLDIILLDIKIPDPEKHRKYCGVDNRLLLENIEKLAGVAVDIYVRVPVIPGINDDPASIAEIAAIAARLDNLVSIKLLPFHKLGGGKYKALDRAYEIDGLDTPSKEQMEKLNKIIVDAGLNVE